MVPFKPLSYRGEGESFQGDYIQFQQPNEFPEQTLIRIWHHLYASCRLDDAFFSVRDGPGTPEKRKQTCQSNVWKKTSFGIKGLLTADICLKDDITHQCLYMENIPFVFAKSAMKCHSDIRLKEQSPKCWLKSVYLQSEIWSLNSTQSNLQWFLYREAQPLRSKWGFAGAKFYFKRDKQV